MLRNICIAVLVLALQGQVHAQLVFDVWGKDIPVALRAKVPDGWTEEKADVFGGELIPTEGEKRQGLVTFVYQYEQQVCPYTVPFRHQVTDEVRLFASRGEYEPVTFAIRTLKDLGEVSLQVTDLLGPNGQTFSNKNIDLRWIKMIYKVTDRDEKIFARKPGILVDRPEQDLKSGTTYPVLINVHVAKGTPAGTYRGKIVIAGAGRTLKELTLKLRVLPIDLPPADDNFAMWYGPSWKPPETIRKHMLDMKALGMHSIFLCHLAPRPVETETGYKLDFENMDRLIEIMRSAGMNGTVIFDGRALNGYATLYGMKKAGKEIPEKYNLYQMPVEKNEHTKAVFCDMLRQIAEHAAQHNWPEYYVYAQEESTNFATKMDALLYFTPMIKEVLGKTVLVSNGPWGGTDEARDHKGLFDLRVYNYLDEKILADVATQKNELWLYNYFSGRAVWGLYLRRTGVKGMSQWAYQWPAAKNPFDPFIAGRPVTGWYFSYPSPDGPLPTVESMVIREGIDDLRYIRLFDKVVDKAARSDDPNVRELAKQSRKSFQEILDAIPLSAPDAREYFKRTSPEDFDSIRTRMIRAIMKLQKAN